ncbi:DUF1214 domain-containing protein [Microvirga rosea]|uniref:DUF1214 domain-containing protein n=1 Tax=Microvirga rosea TaxID=2715425 RepID=UPI001D09DB0D|nr:DUF1214 domain-containing protein [Microvirga rosea]MCB8820080.1 DUF1214 domain-containing protein [Microvirga rosea]
MTARPVSPALLIVYALLLALGLGIGSAYAVLKGNPPFGSRHLGPWQTWPKLGSADADPYMRAIVARRGDIPLATGEGLALTALEDKDGRKLDSACTYRIGPSTPAARWWTLTVYDEAGQLTPSELGRSGFTSSEIVRRGDSTFAVVLSRTLSPGNWLPLPASGPFTVILRLYDIPGAAGLNLNAEDLPTIERVECGA